MNGRRAAVAVLGAACLLLVQAPARAAEGLLVRPLADAEVDWGEGRVIARVGVAARLAAPGPELARPLALRTARRLALGKLRRALEHLPFAQGKPPAEAVIENALATAETLEQELQSDGGVLLTLAVPFSALLRSASAADGGAVAADAGVAGSLIIAVAQMPFDAAPEVVCGEHPLPRAVARYRVGEPPRHPDGRVLPATFRRGHLVIKESACGGELAPTSLLIYVASTPR